MTEIIANMAVQILPNRVKIINSYKITDKSRMKQIIYAIQHDHPELKFNRDYSDLIHEWIAHNRLYRWGIKRNKTKDVDLEFEQEWYLKIIYKILGV